MKVQDTFQYVPLLDSLKVCLCISICITCMSSTLLDELFVGITQER